MIKRAFHPRRPLESAEPTPFRKPPWALIGAETEHVCSDCGETFKSAFAAKVRCDSCVNSYRTLGPLHYRADAADAQLDERLAEAGIYGRAKTDFVLERFRPEDNPRAARIATEFLDQFPDYPSVAFVGNAGTGKSHLAYAIARRLVERRVDVKCQYLPGLVWNLQISDRWRMVAAGDAHPLLKAQVALIDDVGREPKSDVLAGFFDHFFNERWIRRRHTILTSNLPLADLHRWFGSASASRFLEEAWVDELTGPDRRLEPFGGHELAVNEEF